MGVLVAQGDVSPVDADGFVGRIPVRNLWLLMLYASDLFRTSGDSNVGVEESPDEIPDLVGEILAHAVEARQRRRLNSGYRTRNAAIHRVRGRIDVLNTERHRLLERGLVACRYDELTIDTPRNRFVRAALERISRIVGRRELAHRCRLLANSMKAMGVSGMVPTRAQMSTDRFGRNDSEDQLMVAAARLAFDLTLPMESVGNNTLNRADREATWIRRLFEKAVGGFYDVVLQPQGWRVRRGMPLEWPSEQRTSGVDHIMPMMRTDIVLDDELLGRRIVIDTKFTAIVTEGWHREETLRSGFLYQIYAYLRSQAGRGDSIADHADGLLLHPAVDNAVDETVVIQGHHIRFATVDLAAPPAVIRGQLLRVIAPTEQLFRS